MNILKPASRVIVAALLTLSLSACFEQMIRFVTDPGSGELVAIER